MTEMGRSVDNLIIKEGFTWAEEQALRE